MTGPRTVRTVLGDIAPATLGVVDAHDHLFLRSPALPLPLDDEDAALGTLRAFRDLGGGALAQWTPFAMGRRSDRLVAASRATGVHVIAATGLHQEVHYDPELLRRLRSGDALAELFVAELTEGTVTGDDPGGARTGPRAGMIKVAGMFHALDDHTRWVMAAAAHAHHATGAPIGIHHEMGTAAVDVLGLLHGELGVPASSLLLGHLNRFPDPGVHRELAAAGAYLAFDGPSRAHSATDPWLVGSLVALAEAGHTSQLLLGADTTSPGAGPGAPYLLRVLRPRLTRDLGPAAAEAILSANPARAFAAPWPA
ncbi:phosphotriesterase [Streptomyces sp. NPDC021224]|uniref:phosphotriesterase family protein n=1 Tax=unclassified Streptomyces TaxID=2593676 RepID=UPI0037A69A08